MRIRGVLFSSAMLAGAAMMFGATAGQAAETFTSIGNIPVQAMSADQMAQVEGKAHIALLVAFKRGVDVADLPAADVLLGAAPANKNFTPNPSRNATAFDFLN